MLLHTVLIRPNARVTESDLDALALQTARIAERLCGTGNFEVGPNSTQEPLDQGYAFGFILRFANRDALSVYHADPEHELLSQRIQALAATVLVFDLES